MRARRHQVLGLLFGGRHARGILAFGGDQNLLQNNALIAHELHFVLVVIFLDFVVLHRHLLGNFLADHALSQGASFHFLPEVFKRHAALFLDILLELFRIGNLAIALDRGHLFADVAVHVNIEVLGFLRQEQLIDTIPKHVFLAFGELLLQFGADRATGAQGFDELLAAACEIAPRDDIAVAFGDDLLHHGHIGGGECDGGQAHRSQY